MRKLINILASKVSSLLGTSQIKSIHEDVVRIKDVSDGILIERFLNESLFQNRKYSQSKRITHFHRSVFTQNGEDGIIEEIFNRIGVTNEFFVEFGVHGVKNNSTFLLVKGWNGLWIGGKDEGEKLVSKKFRSMIERNKLLYRRSWITKDNIQDIFLQSNVPNEFDFLSIDLDGNDYWVWESINRFSPRVVCIEYNASFPPNVSWIMSYNEKHRWDQSNYFGASLSALEHLGRRKGYELVGCDITGCNAFFVRKDQNLDLFESPFTAAHHYEPPRYHLRKASGHKQSFGPFEKVI